MICQTVKPIFKVFKILAARYPDSGNNDDMKLYQKTEVPRIWMMHGEYVKSLFATVALLPMFSLALASRAPEASPSRPRRHLGRLDGSEAQMCRKF